ncbi:MAG: hypothetical protein J0L92_20385 [Deltaproteobacteria bacterium]|nr:hypothetical protein [Deltaproteobacteria bacterium]
MTNANSRMLAPVSLLVLGLALLGCPSPMPVADAAVLDQDAVQPADDVYAPTDAASACVDVSGAWVWSSSCSRPDAMLTPHSCITQSGCTATILDSYGPLSVLGTSVTTATVDGNTITMTADGLTCTVVHDGDSATAHCESDMPAYTCDGVGARVSFPEATSYCCDVAADSCGAGERCGPVAGESAEDRFTACVPAGTIAEGESCTRTGGRIGADDCAPGLTCANIGQLDINQRTCVRLCGTTSDCESDEICWVFAAAPHAGVCRPTCTYLGTDCPAGFTCQAEPSWAPMSTTTDIPLIATDCVITGTGALGSTCADGIECGRDMACAFDLARPELPAQCRTNCDPAHPCPMGEHCQPRGYMNPEQYGACVAD